MNNKDYKFLRVLTRIFFLKISAIAFIITGFKYFVNGWVFKIPLYLFSGAFWLLIACMYVLICYRDYEIIKKLYGGKI